MENIEEYNIYEICEEILIEILDTLRLKSLKSNELVFQLWEFLISDNTELEVVLDAYQDILLQDRNCVKIVMMLMIVSGSYKFSLWNLMNDIDVEENIAIMEELEQLTPSNIIHAFLTRDYEKITENILDYFCYLDESYLFRNESAGYILSEQKTSNLLDLNPFEALVFADYIKPEELLESEQIIQSFIAIYDKTQIEFPFDFEDESSDEPEDETAYNIEIRKMIHEKLKEKYDDEKIINIYRYLLANAYEQLKVQAEVTALPKEAQAFITYCEAQKSWLDGINRYFKDSDFSAFVIDTFINKNYSLEKDDLYTCRQTLKKTDGEKVLKMMSPYYREEEIVFSQY